ncbi:hypothetical protein T459_27824 [Capsicum annuum]|uniref:Uncharacterized protein n=1 Tax=Capsicum annuum TaxID=4072 RepID=A0A2G2YF17_CAPAN|nr:hypothetical protein T459_27824 [Capsicum annuum]
MNVASDEEIERLSEDVASNSSGLLPSNLIDIIFYRVTSSIKTHLDTSLDGIMSHITLKEDRDILSDKQPDNLQGEPSRDPMVDNQNDDSSEKRFEKKRRAEEGKNTKDHSDEKEEAAEERVTGLGPLNMEEIRQSKNQVELSKSIIIELPDNCI